MSLNCGTCPHLHSYCRSLFPQRKSCSRGTAQKSLNEHREFWWWSDRGTRLRRKIPELFCSHPFGWKLEHNLLKLLHSLCPRIQHALLKLEIALFSDWKLWLLSGILSSKLPIGLHASSGISRESHHNAGNFGFHQQNSQKDNYLGSNHWDGQASLRSYPHSTPFNRDTCYKGRLYSMISFVDSTKCPLGSPQHNSFESIGTLPHKLYKQTHQCILSKGKCSLSTLPR